MTEIVYQLVQVYGMNDKVGQLAFPKDPSMYGQDKLYSEATAEVMDAEVKVIVDEAYRRTLALMLEKQKEVVLVAQMLIEKETISHNDVASIIGKRPWSAGKEYDAYVSGSAGDKPPVVEEEQAAPAAEEEPTVEPIGPVLSPI